MYLVDGQHLDVDDPRFDAALAEAYAGHHRPLCLCKADGVPMYVARFGPAYLIKRMPCTGNQHAPWCSSYELPTELLAEGAASPAVVEDPETGLTTLRLGFALSHFGSRSLDQPRGGLSESITSGRQALDLAGLLRYLWNRAELNRWQPGFAGKRTWAVVRRLLLSAAASSVVRGESLQERLYVPETFAAERCDEIRARREARWAPAAPGVGGSRRLLLLCGEIKEIAPTRHGCVVLIKHLPDQPLACEEQRYQRLERRFETALALWGADSGIHLIAMATFDLNAAGIPRVDRLTLMPVDEHWIPVRDMYEVRLLQALVRERRRFIKISPVTSRDGNDHPSVALTDAGDEAVLLHVAGAGSSDAGNGTGISEPWSPYRWVWQVCAGTMPPLPVAAPIEGLKRPPSGLQQVRAS